MRLALIAVLLASCSSSGAAPTAAPRTYAEARAMLAVAQCDRKVRCGEIGASERAACLADPDGAKSMGYGPAWFQRTTDALAHGRLRFDPSRFADCLAAVRGPCLAVPDPARRCALLAPAVAPGGPCTDWGECIDGHCSAQLGCTGRCVAHKQLGQTCSATGDDGLCDDATFCDQRKAVCTAKLAAGARCREWNSCRDGMACVGYHVVREEPQAPEEEVLGTCTAAGTAGAACRPEYRLDCAVGFACDWQTRTCFARIARGDACRSPETCADGLACSGLEAMWDPHAPVWRVGTPGTCTAPLDVGARCDVFANPLATGCPATTTCDPKTSTCVHAALAGDPCQPNGGCRGNLYCSPTTRICTAKLPYGAVCVPPPADGDDPCSLGRCDPQRRVCVPLQPCTKP